MHPTAVCICVFRVCQTRNARTIHEYLPASLAQRLAVTHALVCDVDLLQTTTDRAHGDFPALTTIDQHTEFIQRRIRLSGDEFGEF
jgi:hypothetical protein